MGLGEASDRVQRCTGSTLVGTDAVHPAGEHQGLIVGGIASKKMRRAVLLVYQVGEMIRSVTWCGHRDNVPGMCQSPAANEGPKRLRCEFKRSWIEPTGPTMRQVSAYTPNPSACGAKFSGGDKDFTAGEMCQAAIMIHVQMGENDLFHITRSNAQRTQLRTDFIFPIDSKNDFPSRKGMIRRPCFEQMLSLAGVDDDDTFLVFDRPRVGW